MPTESQRQPLPSGPGEFHPESLAVPDVIVSPHPARAAMGECRRRACPTAVKLASSDSSRAKAAAAGLTIFQANAENEVPPTTEGNRNGRDEPGHRVSIGLQPALSPAARP